MNRVDLSIIIVHFNTPDLLKDCVQSIVKFTKKISYEVIVVDNASTKGQEILNELGKDKNVQLIKNKKNLGFSLGNNEGIKNSKGKYILLLNSDTVIQSDVLGYMVSWLNKNKNIGVTTCALRNSNQSLQATGGFFPTLARIFSWMAFIDDIPFLVNKSYHVRPGNNIRDLDWITGAFFMIRRDVVEQVGTLDADYFMYVEDMDYCYRIKRAGWRVVYNPRESIIHFGGASSTQEFPLISEFRGVLTFYKKHMPMWQEPLVRIIFKLGSLFRIVILGILKGPTTAKIYAKAFRAI